MRHLVGEAGLADAIIIESAGTGSWHVGEQAHEGTRRVLHQHDINYAGRARQIAGGDVDGKTYIIAMSAANVNDFHQRFGDYDRLYRLLDFAEGSNVRDVPDP